MFKEKRNRQSRLMDSSLVDKIEDVENDEPKDVYAPQQDELFSLFDEVDRVETLIATGEEPIKKDKQTKELQGFGLGSVFLLAFMVISFIALCVCAWILY